MYWTFSYELKYQEVHEVESFPTNFLFTSQANVASYIFFQMTTQRIQEFPPQINDLVARYLANAGHKKCTCF